MRNIIGREQELHDLERLYNSRQAQFVVVYGRRRVGKTFLIDEALKGKITFRHAGLSPLERSEGQNSMQRQLKHFYNSLVVQGMKKSRCPKSWLDAFLMLELHLQSMNQEERQVVFLDELPWMDTPRSGFLTAFEGFWNNWGCHRDNMMLVVCGSATSWIQDNLIDAHGGLYGRVTAHPMRLHPFTLHECEEFYHSRGIRMSRYDIVQSYMVYGGIPYYMSFLESDKSLDQNINCTFFGRDPLLKDEFVRLFSSVFSNPQEMMKIIRVLNTRHSGFTRQQLIEKTGLEDNGAFSKMLKALIASDFVDKYVPFGLGERESHYRLVDAFCRFYLHFIEGKTELITHFWQGDASQAIVSWRGIAFEDVCYMHVDQIKKALGISGLTTKQSAWAYRGNDETDGTQIDLLIERPDHVINMCEMKFYNEEFIVNKTYDRILINRQNLLEKQVGKRTIVHRILVTTYGLRYNEYSGDFVKTITMDNLFE